MFKIRRTGDFWEIIKDYGTHISNAYIFNGIFPGIELPKFNTKREAKKWLKVNEWQLL